MPLLKRYIKSKYAGCCLLIVSLQAFSCNDADTEVPLYTPEEAAHIIDSATGREYEKILRQSEKDLVIRSRIEVPQKADSIRHAQDSLAHHIRLPRQ